MRIVSNGVKRMKTVKSLWTGILSAFGMLVIILDSKTALWGAQDGIELCVSSVIPALFPFFFLSSLFNNVLTGISLPFLRPIGKLCGVPQGAESLLVLGLIGGYPVGAQAVADAYRSNKISHKVAERLLGFCSNAGPSFIFGILSGLFSSQITVWIMWLVHISSALLTGMILPNKQQTVCYIDHAEKINLSQALERSIKVLSSVCGWVILFRVLIAFCQKWFLWLLPMTGQCIVIGLLELTNGCCNLSAITLESVRFVLCSCMLAMGSLCVLMQTVSVTRPLGLGMYIPGKILQTAISLFLASMIQQLLYPHETAVSFAVTIIAVIFIIASLLLQKKKSSSIMQNSVV